MGVGAMTEIGRLTRNELVKTFTRRSVKIVLAVILALVLAYHGIVNLTQKNNERYQDTDYAMENLRSQLEYYVTNKPDGYEIESERVRLMLDNRINPFELSWRLDAVDDVATLLRQQRAAENESDFLTAQAIQEQIDREKEWIASDDYRAYFADKVKSAKGNYELNEESRKALAEQYQYVLDYSVAAAGSEWKYRLYSNIISAQNELSDFNRQQSQGMSGDPKRVSQLQKSLLVAKYRIENERKVVAVGGDGNYYYGTPSTYWEVFYRSGETLTLAALFAIVLAAILLSGEFATGTVRALFAAPAGRGKILIAKYLAVLLSALALCAGLYAWNAMAAGFFHGFGEIGAKYLYVSGETVHEISGFWPAALHYLLLYLRVAVFATMGLCLGALFRNAAVPIAIGSICVLVGPYAASYLQYSLGQDWAKYLLFANLNFDTLFQGGQSYQTQTIAFALIVVGVHLVVFLLTAWDAFVRRDVKF